MACLFRSVSVLVVCMAVVTAPTAEAAITCGQVVSSLAPCLAYLRGGGAVSGSCCSGVRSLNAAAGTSSDRRAVCNCLKQAAGSSPNIDPGLAASLSGKCGVKLNINNDVNCDQIN